MLQILVDNRGANIDYARACVADCLRRGDSAIASHLLYTQPGVLRDDVPGERELGIAAGLHDAGQLKIAKPGKRQIKALELQLAEFEAQQLRIPTGVERELIIGEPISLDLRLRPPARHHRRHIGNAQLMCCQHSPMPGDQRTLFVNEHRVGEAKFADRGRDSPRRRVPDT